MQMRFTQSMTKLSSKLQYKYVHKAIHRTPLVGINYWPEKHTFTSPTAFPVQKTVVR